MKTSTEVSTKQKGKMKNPCKKILFEGDLNHGPPGPQAKLNITRPWRPPIWVNLCWIEIPISFFQICFLSFTNLIRDKINQIGTQQARKRKENLFIILSQTNLPPPQVEIARAINYDEPISFVENDSFAKLFKVLKKYSR